MKASMDNENDEQDASAESEHGVQAQLFAKFKAAQEAGDEAEAERIARIFIEHPWREQPATPDAFDIRLFIERINAARREKEGRDSIRILRKCLHEKWDHALALSTLEEIDRLRQAGWDIPADGRDVVAGCRARCKEHVLDDQKEAHWRKLCDDLRDAVRRHDVPDVRRILSAPEFRNREPDDESLLWHAQRLANGHAHRSRPHIKSVALFGVVVLLVALAGLSARKSREKRFDKECVEEAEKLSALRDAFDPIGQISAELGLLQHENPAVLADPRVFAYFDILEKLKTENAARTNEIAALLTALDSLATNNWDGADAGTIQNFERVDELLKPHDIAYARHLQELKESAIGCAEAKRNSQRKDAENYVLNLRPILTSLAKRLETELPDDELAALARDCDEALAKWDVTFAKGADDLDASLDVARRRFREARARQDAAVADLAALKAAGRAMDILALRDHLRQTHSAYSPIAALQPIPYSADDVRGVLNGLAAGLTVQNGEETEPIGMRRVFSAGKIQFDPLGPDYRRDKAGIVPHVAVQEGALYVLRRNGEHLVLRRAFVLRGKTQAVAAQEVKDELFPGEPLFQIR